jgi:hypothetical protein
MESYNLEGRAWWKEIVITILLIVPTLFFGNEYYGLLLPFFMLAINYSTWKERWLSFRTAPFQSKGIKFVWLPLIFILGATLNKIFNGDPILCLKDYYAAFFLIPLLLIASVDLLNQRTFLVFLLFVSAECFIGIVEYFYNVRSVFLPLSETLIIQSKELLYSSRVYGFTMNSSYFGVHILIGFIFLVRSELKPILYWIFFPILLIGLLLSFNRTVIMVVVVYYLLQLIYIGWINRKRVYSGLKKSFNQNIVISSVFLLVLINIPFLKNSFTRDGSVEQLAYGNQNIEPVASNDVVKSPQRPKMDTVSSIAEPDENFDEIAGRQLTITERHARPLLEVAELDTTTHLSRYVLSATEGLNTSGRILIWLNYLDFIEHHFYFGNGSNKLMMRVTNPETKEIVLYHAHNSFLEIIGTHGIILAVFYLFLYFLWWGKTNLPILLAILFYSMAQYGIFWGFSILDAIFIYFLIVPKNNKDIGYQEKAA